MKHEQKVVQAILGSPANQIRGISAEHLHELAEQFAKEICAAQFATEEAVRHASNAAKATLAAGRGKTAEDRQALSIMLQPLTALSELPANILALAYVASDEARSLRVRGGAMRQMEIQGWYFGEYSGHPTASHSFSKVDGGREYFVALFSAKLTKKA